VTLEFAIMRDGSVKGLKIVRSSEDMSLDRAAWGSIMNAIPLRRLPAEFSGDDLKLRANFVYNPAMMPEQASPPDNKQPDKK
jgi:TonB family protein